MIEVDQLKCFWSGDVAKLLNKLSYFHFLPTSLKLPIFENIFKLSALKRFASQPLVSLHCAYIYCIIFHCTLGALFLRDASNFSCIVPQSLWRLYSAPLPLAIQVTRRRQLCPNYHLLKDQGCTYLFSLFLFLQQMSTFYLKLIWFHSVTICSRLILGYTTF